MRVYRFVFIYPIAHTRERSYEYNLERTFQKGEGFACNDGESP